MSTLEYVEIVLIVLAIFFLGFSLAKWGIKKKYDGTIVIGTTVDEDGERDRIGFIIDIDLDDIKKQKEIRFKVDDRTSQNSQAVR